MVKAWDCFLRATSSMFLEKQIKKVDDVLTAFEDQLAADTGILDEPNAIRNHSKQLQVDTYYTNTMLILVFIYNIIGIHSDIIYVLKYTFFYYFFFLDNKVS